MATESGITKIVAPNFTAILWDAIKGAAITAFNKMPYADTPYYKYGLYVIGGLIVLGLIVWYWDNFLRKI